MDEFEEIDRLDATERSQEMQEELDRIVNFSDIENENFVMDDLGIEFSSDQSIEVSEVFHSNANNDYHKDGIFMNIAEDSKEISHHMNYQNEDILLSNHEVEDDDTIKRLITELQHHKHTLKSMELKLNHAQLQISALSNQEQLERMEKEKLQYANAVLQQDKLLLQSKLAAVTKFENNKGTLTRSNSGDGWRGGRHTIDPLDSPRRHQIDPLDELRGQLLSAAQNQIANLEESQRHLRLQFENHKEQLQEQIHSLHATNSAFQEENSRLVEQLATRTVLYNAQERRWFEKYNTSEKQQNMQYNNLLELQSKCQFLQQQFDKSDSQRMETILQYKQSQIELSREREIAVEAVERVHQLEFELTSATSSVQELQSTVLRLKGLDLHQIERGMVQEVDLIKASAREEVDTLKRQLSEARGGAEEAARNNELLRDQLESLRRSWREQVELFRAIKEGGILDGLDNRNQSLFLSESSGRERGGNTSGQNDTFQYSETDITNNFSLSGRYATPTSNNIKREDDKNDSFSFSDSMACNMSTGNHTNEPPPLIYYLQFLRKLLGIVLSPKKGSIQYNFNNDLEAVLSALGKYSINFDDHNSEINALKLELEELVNQAEGGFLKNALLVSDHDSTGNTNWEDNDNDNDSGIDRVGSDGLAVDFLMGLAPQCDNNNNSNTGDNRNSQRQSWDVTDTIRVMEKQLRVADERAEHAEQLLAEKVLEIQSLQNHVNTLAPPLRSTSTSSSDIDVHAIWTEGWEEGSRGVQGALSQSLQREEELRLQLLTSQASFEILQKKWEHHDSETATATAASAAIATLIHNTNQWLQRLVVELSSRIEEARECGAVTVPETRPPTVTSIHTSHTAPAPVSALTTSTSITTSNDSSNNNSNSSYPNQSLFDNNVVFELPAIPIPIPIPMATSIPTDFLLPETEGGAAVVGEALSELHNNLSQLAQALKEILTIMQYFMNEKKTDCANTTTDENTVKRVVVGEDDINNNINDANDSDIGRIETMLSDVPMEDMTVAVLPVLDPDCPPLLLTIITLVQSLRTLTTQITRCKRLSSEIIHDLTLKVVPYITTIYTKNPTQFIHSYTAECQILIDLLNQITVFISQFQQKEALVDRMAGGMNQLVYQQKMKESFSSYRAKLQDIIDIIRIKVWEAKVETMNENTFQMQQTFRQEHQKELEDLRLQVQDLLVQLEGVSETERLNDVIEAATSTTDLSLSDDTNNGDDNNASENSSSDSQLILLNNEIYQLSQQLMESEERLLQSHKKLLVADSSNNKLSQALSTSQSNLQESLASNDVLSSQITSLEAQLYEMQLQLTSHRSDSERHQQEITDLNQTYRTLLSDSTAFQNNTNANSNLLQETENRLYLLLSEYESVSVERLAMRLRAQEFRLALEEEAQRHSTTQTTATNQLLSLQEKDTQILQLQSDVHEITTQLNDTAATNHLLQHQLEEEKTRFSYLQIKCTDLLSHQSSLDHQLVESAERTANLNDELNKVTMELGRTKETVRLLERQLYQKDYEIAALITENNNFRTKLQEAEQSHTIQLARFLELETMYTSLLNKQSAIEHATGSLDRLVTPEEDLRRKMEELVTYRQSQQFVNSSESTTLSDRMTSPDASTAPQHPTDLPDDTPPVAWLSSNLTRRDDVLQRATHSLDQLVRLESGLREQLSLLSPQQPNKNKVSELDDIDATTSTTASIVNHNDRLELLVSSLQAELASKVNELAAAQSLINNLSCSLQHKQSEVESMTLRCNEMEKSHQRQAETYLKDLEEGRAAADLRYQDLVHSSQLSQTQLQESTNKYLQKAAEVFTLTQQLQDSKLLSQQYSNQYQVANNKISQLEVQYQESQQQSQRLQTEKSQLEGSLQESLLKLHSLESLLTSLRTSLAEKETAITLAEERLTEADEKTKVKDGQIDNLMQSKTQLMERQSQMESELSSLNLEIQNVSLELTTTITKLNGRENEFRQLTSENNTLTVSINRLETDKSVLLENQKSIQHFEQLLREKENLLQSQRESNDKNEILLKSLEFKNQFLQKSFDESNMKLYQLQVEVRDASNSMKLLQHENDMLHSRIQTSKDTLLQRDTVIQELQDNIKLSKEKESTQIVDMSTYELELNEVKTMNTELKQSLSSLEATLLSDKAAYERQIELLSNQIKEQTITAEASLQKEKDISHKYNQSFELYQQKEIECASLSSQIVSLGTLLKETESPLLSTRQEMERLTFAFSTSESTLTSTVHQLMTLQTLLSELQSSLTNSEQKSEALEIKQQQDQQIIEKLKEEVHGLQLINQDLHEKSEAQSKLLLEASNNSSSLEATLGEAEQQSSLLRLETANLADSLDKAALYNDTLIHKVTSLSQSLQETQFALALSKQQTAAAEKLVKENESSAASLQQQVTAWKQSADEARFDAVNQSTRAEVHSQSLSQLEVQYQESQQQSQRLQTEKSQLEVSLQESLLKLHSLEALLTSLRTSLAEKETALHQSQQQLTEFQRSIQEHEARQSESQVDRIQLQSSFARMEQRAIISERALREAESRLESTCIRSIHIVEETSREDNQEVDLLKQQREIDSKRIKELEDELQQTVGRYQELQNTLTSMAEKLETFQSNYTQKEEELTALKLQSLSDTNAIISLTNENASLQSLLHCSQPSTAQAASLSPSTNASIQSEILSNNTQTNQKLLTQLNTQSQLLASTQRKLQRAEEEVLKLQVEGNQFMKERKTYSERVLQLQVQLEEKDKLILHLSTTSASTSINSNMKDNSIIIAQSNSSATTNDSTTAKCNHSNTDKNGSVPVDKEAPYTTTKAHQPPLHHQQQQQQQQQQQPQPSKILQNINTKLASSKTTQNIDEMQNLISKLTLENKAYILDIQERSGRIYALSKVIQEKDLAIQQLEDINKDLHHKINSGSNSSSIWRTRIDESFAETASLLSDDMVDDNHSNDMSSMVVLTGQPTTTTSSNSVKSKSYLPVHQTVNNNDNNKNPTTTTTSPTTTTATASNIRTNTSSPVTLVDQSVVMRNLIQSIKAAFQSTEVTMAQETDNWRKTMMNIDIKNEKIYKLQANIIQLKNSYLYKNNISMINNNKIANNNRVLKPIFTSRNKGSSSSSNNSLKMENSITQLRLQLFEIKKEFLKSSDFIFNDLKSIRNLFNKSSIKRSVTDSNRQLNQGQSAAPATTVTHHTKPEKPNTTPTLLSLSTDAKKEAEERRIERAIDREREKNKEARFQLHDRLKAKYHRKLEEMKLHFELERTSLIRVLRRECRDIIEEAQRIYERKLRSGRETERMRDYPIMNRTSSPPIASKNNSSNNDNSNSNSNNKSPVPTTVTTTGSPVVAHRHESSLQRTPQPLGAPTTPGGSSGTPLRRSQVYPEMLSPGDTLKLLHEILRKGGQAILTELDKSLSITPAAVHLTSNSSNTLPIDPEKKIPIPPQTYTNQIFLTPERKPPVAMVVTPDTNYANKVSQKNRNVQVQGDTSTHHEQKQGIVHINETTSPTTKSGNTSNHQNTANFEQPNYKPTDRIQEKNLEYFERKAKLSDSPLLLPGPLKRLGRQVETTYTKNSAGKELSSRGYHSSENRKKGALDNNERNVGKDLPRRKLSPVFDIYEK